jgi:hypothetical protein
MAFHGDCQLHGSKESTWGEKLGVQSAEPHKDEGMELKGNHTKRIKKHSHLTAKRSKFRISSA